MDSETYDQVSLSKVSVSDVIDFLNENIGFAIVTLRRAIPRHRINNKN